MHLGTCAPLDMLLLGFTQLHPAICHSRVARPTTLSRASPPLCRFPSTELYKGSGALVQMQSVDQAAASIQTLNGSFPRGASQPLLVRYADSPGARPALQPVTSRQLLSSQPHVPAVSILC